EGKRRRRTVTKRCRRSRRERPVRRASTRGWLPSLLGSGWRGREWGQFAKEGDGRQDAEARETNPEVCPFRALCHQVQEVVVPGDEVGSTRGQRQVDVALVVRIPRVRELPWHVRRRGGFPGQVLQEGFGPFRP